MADETPIDAVAALTGQAADAEVLDEVSNAADDATDDLGDAGKKALEAERTARRDAEKRFKQLEKTLQAERAKGLSDADRAIQDAKAAGFAEAQMEAGKRLARAEIRALASEKGLDVTALLEDLDLSRFVGDDGEPDDAVIASAIKRWAAIAPQPNRPRGDVGQGARSKTLTDPNEEFVRLLQGG